jgi:hypothetical protein
VASGRNPGFDSTPYGEGPDASRSSPRLTEAQLAALEVLADGKEHETHKQRSGLYGRVNYIAASSLIKLGLVHWHFGYRETISISGPGLAELERQR